MHAVLERVVSQIAGEIRELDAQTTQLHPHNLTYRWTAQQVVEHLVLGYRQTSKALETRLTKGRISRNQQRTWVQWSLQLMILTFGEIPRGVPTLDETMPVKGQFPPMDGEQLGRLLYDEIDAMDTLLDTCRRRFGMDRVARHPWLGPLRVDQWRRFHVVHGLHHVVQLRSVIAAVAPSRVPVILSGSLVKELHIPVQRPLA